MAVLSNIELVLFDEENNETVVYFGDLELPDLQLDNQNASVSNNRTLAGEEYDSAGAVKFVVVVILVYSMSIMFLILMLARRKSYSKTLDAEVTRYIKGLESTRQQAKQEEVLKMRLKWPGNFIGLRFDSRPQVNNISASDVEDYPEWPCLERVQEESVSFSDDDYVEIPATTVRTEVEYEYGSEPDESFHTSSGSLGLSAVEDYSHNLDNSETKLSVEMLDVEYPKYYKPRVPAGRRVGIVQMKQPSNDSSNSDYLDQERERNRKTSQDDHIHIQGPSTSQHKTDVTILSQEDKFKQQDQNIYPSHRISIQNNSGARNLPPGVHIRLPNLNRNMNDHLRFPEWRSRNYVDITNRK